MNNIVTSRSRLEPVRVTHAAEMYPLLCDPRIYVFTNGKHNAFTAMRRFKGELYLAVVPLK